MLLLAHQQGMGGGAATVTLERYQTVSVSGVQVVGSTSVTLDAYMTRVEGTAVYYVPGGSGVTIVGPF